MGIVEVACRAASAAGVLAPATMRLTGTPTNWAARSLNASGGALGVVNRHSRWMFCPCTYPKLARPARKASTYSDCDSRGPTDRYPIVGTTCRDHGAVQAVNRLEMPVTDAPTPEVLAEPGRAGGGGEV